MTHTYSITGMTCNGCKASVEKYLGKIEGVSNVSVALDQGEATVTMNHHIATETLKKALPEKYSLSEKKQINVFTSAEMEPEKSKLQQLKPLFLILGYIAAAAILLHYKSWNTTEAMLDFMGLFFIVFSFFKLLDLKGFSGSFQMYDPLAKAAPIYSWIYPFLEVALGLMLLMRFEVAGALLITMLILGITTIGVSKVLLSKQKIQCACLGTALKLPMTQATFIENSLMIVMAIIMLFKIYSA